MDIQDNGLVTREGHAAIHPKGKTVLAEPDNDLLKLVYIERVSRNGEMFTGFVRGFGMRNGAVATTLVWDASGIIAIGSDDNILSYPQVRIHF